MEKKPNVFPQQGQSNTTGNQTRPEHSQNNDAYTNSHTVPAGEQAAAEEMRRRTAEQLRLRSEAVAKTKNMSDDGAKAREELMREMDNKKVAPEQNTPQGQQQLIDSAMSQEELAKMQNYINSIEQNRGRKTVDIPRSSVHHPEHHLYLEEEAIRIAQQANQTEQPNYNSAPSYEDMKRGNYGYQVPPNPPKPPSNYGQPSDMEPSRGPSDVYIQQLSEPQYNAPFDVIPLPSKGKLYKGYNKSTIKVSYMTTADENILTSPNLLESGQFLEILLNRKILEPNLRYKDLVEGDRDAIMLWLRATGYGNIYPIVVDDEKGEPFETEVDLNEIKTIELNAEPDENGHFSMTLPVSGVNIKFKILTISDLDEISDRVKYEQETLKLPVNNESTYTLAKQIVSVNGDTNPDTIRSFSETMRIGDKTKFEEHLKTINCGVDMNITVRTPGDGSVNRFLPINVKFFWPNFGV